MSAARATRAAYCEIEVRANDDAQAERLAAEAYAAGATGLEERACAAGVMLIVYAPARAAAAVRDALLAAAPAIRVGLPAAVPDVRWSEQWKRGLTATVISARLLIRPSFVSAELLPGQREIVIDPGQAFGTGAHASTRLALEWIDQCAPVFAAGARVLDIGTGTGVLALAAAALGASEVIAFDTDPLAIEAARANARDNRMAARLRLFIGGLESVGARGFDCAVANLLRSEMMPLLAGIAARLREGGCAVLSGLLASECDAARAALHAVGLRAAGERSLADANGDRWAALLTTR